MMQQGQHCAAQGGVLIIFVPTSFGIVPNFSTDLALWARRLAGGGSTGCAAVGVGEAAALGPVTVATTTAGTTRRTTNRGH
jgi:hypothetical protein